MIEYRREVDGLRAVAVLPVIFFHAGFSEFRGGFIGVDVFFVISGYLITSIIISEHNTGKFSLVNFYERRVRRILPALFLVMAACLPAAWFWLLPRDMQDFSQSVMAVSAFVSNILFWQESGYFDTAAELKPLLHTWSLAVEEQYYVLFPLFLMVAWRLGKGSIFVLLAVAGIVSLAAAQWGAYRDPSATFFLLPTRGWELAIGACTALYLASSRVRHFSPAVEEGLGILGMMMIALAILLFDKRTPFPSLYALLPTVGTALVILFAHPFNVVGRVLGAKVLVGIGLISYAAYLWHQPLFAFARHSPAEPVSRLQYLALSAVALLLAWLTWRYVETPFRDRRRLSRGTVFSLAIAASLSFILLGYLGSRDGLSWRFEGLRQLLPGYEIDNDLLRERSWGELEKLALEKGPGLSIEAYESHLWFDPQRDTIKVLIVGNSHGKDLFNALWLNREAFSRYEFARYGAQISCFDETGAHALFDTPNYRHANVVLISTRWSEWRPCEGGVDGDFEGLENLIERLLQDRKLPILASPSPEFPIYGKKTLADRVILDAWRRSAIPVTEDDRRLLADSANRQYFVYRNGKTVVREHRQRLQQIASRFGVPFADKGSYLCDEEAGRCLGLTDDLRKVFFDYGHYTIEGARQLGHRIHQSGWLDIQISDPGAAASGGGVVSR